MQVSKRKLILLAVVALLTIVTVMHFTGRDEDVHAKRQPHIENLDGQKLY